jgi:hypothetical protein
MNREGAETFLRLLAEAELRGPTLLPPPPGIPDPPVAVMSAALVRAAWALTTVGALGCETADGILADVEFAVAARHRPEPPEAGVISSAGPGPAFRPARLHRFATARLMGRSARWGPGGPPPRPSRAEAAGPDRYVPVGLMILFHDETISGELDLMSYAHTASGARFAATWRARDPLGSRHRGLPPVEQFILTDDRGNHYDLLFTGTGRPESSCDLGLHPDPPPDLRWLDITAPGEQAVRVDLDRPADRPALAVSDRELSTGEHLLNRVADRMLTMVPEFPSQVTPGPLSSLGAGLGAAIAALEAAEVLSKLSPVPGRLAALCASLGVRGHGITAAPALDLPEPWLSMLSHYHRRKPDAAPAGDGFAAVAVALPEFDGLRLVLLGLHNCDGDTWMNALAYGQLPHEQPGPLRLDVAFPLSIWVRDDAGRWHVARPTGWFDGGGEAMLTLRLAPPLTRACDLIEVRAAGRSAEVSATVPLRWGYRP